MGQQLDETSELHGEQPQSIQFARRAGLSIISQQVQESRMKTSKSVKGEKVYDFQQTSLPAFLPPMEVSPDVNFNW